YERLKSWAASFTSGTTDEAALASFIQTCDSPLKFASAAYASGWDPCRENSLGDGPRRLLDGMASFRIVPTTGPWWSTVNLPGYDRPAPAFVTSSLHYMSAVSGDTSGATSLAADTSERLVDTMCVRSADGSFHYYRIHHFMALPSNVQPWNSNPFHEE